jgi:hypothetical protein
MRAITRAATATSRGGRPSRKRVRTRRKCGTCAANLRSSPTAVTLASHARSWVSDDPSVEWVQPYSIWLVNWFMSK